MAGWARRVESARMDGTITLTQQRADHLDAVALIRELDEHLDALYPVKSRHGFGVAKRVAENVAFFVLRVDGEPAACAGVKLFGTAFGEVKRMHTRPAFRGRRLGERLLEALASHARMQGARMLRLETGIHQRSAIQMYERWGFRPIPPFREDPLRVRYEKALG